MHPVATKFAEVEMAVTVRVELCFWRAETKSDIMNTLEDNMKAKNIPRKIYSMMKSNSDPKIASQRRIVTFFKGEDVEKAI
jgi:predicted transcriptional regulator